MARRKKRNESDYQREIVAYAKLKNWAVVHFTKLYHRGRWFTPAAIDGKGFPDLILVRDERILFIEVKTDTGRLTNEQILWRKRILRCGLSFIVARPSTYEEVKTILE
jgi:hypothetical protein